jgi:hypothetical protein
MTASLHPVESSVAYIIEGKLASFCMPTRLVSLATLKLIKYTTFYAGEYLFYFSSRHH